MAQIAAPAFGPLGAIASRVIGGLVSSSSGIPGLLQGVTFGFGGDFIGGFVTGFGCSFYVSNSGFRAGINEAIGSALEAVKNVIL